MPNQKRCKGVTTLTIGNEVYTGVATATITHSLPLTGHHEDAGLYEKYVSTGGGSVRITVAFNKVNKTLFDLIGTIVTSFSMASPLDGEVGTLTASLRANMKCVIGSPDTITFDPKDLTKESYTFAFYDPAGGSTNPLQITIS